MFVCGRGPGRLRRLLASGLLLGCLANEAAAGFGRLIMMRGGVHQADAGRRPEGAIMMWPGASRPQLTLKGPGRGRWGRRRHHRQWRSSVTQTPSWNGLLAANAARWQLDSWAVKALRASALGLATFREAAFSTMA